jgi:murein DD-endopeptidase MepM/ murein hydrolase activator NlpD
MSQPDPSLRSFLALFRMTAERPFPKLVTFPFLVTLAVLISQMTSAGAQGQTGKGTPSAIGRRPYSSAMQVSLLEVEPQRSKTRKSGKQASKKPKKSAGQLRKELRAKRERMQAMRRQIGAKKKVERNLKHEIGVVEERIDTTEHKLDDTRERLGDLRTDNKRLRKRIDMTTLRLANRRNVLMRRLRQNYAQGKTGYMQVLLRSSSIHEYLSRSHYVERIVQSDSELIAGIKEDRAQLEEDKRKLEGQIGELAHLESGLEELETQYKHDVGEKRGLLGEVRQDRKQMENVLDQLEEDSRSIEATIRAMQRTPRGRQRMQKAWSGSFGRPADGPIRSQYGMRYHPILHRNRMHTGLDIGAGLGSPIRVAGDGEVILASRFGGYGNCVIVDHGGGVSTLYGHCSAILVRTGQLVKKGQHIARVGATGLATGPHLHFEVRHNGRPVNPN